MREDQVERVARAIFLEEGRAKDVTWEDADTCLALCNWGGPPIKVSDYYRGIARAAISAMEGGKGVEQATRSQALATVPSPSGNGGWRPSDEQIKRMVDRFLGWSLPEDFHPDAGITFKPEYNVEYSAKRGRPPPRHKPSGTNLFDATQAEAMIRYIVAELPQEAEGLTAPAVRSEAVPVSQLSTGKNAITNQQAAALASFAKEMIEWARNHGRGDKPLDGTDMLDAAERHSLLGERQNLSDWLKRIPEEGADG